MAASIRVIEEDFEINEKLHSSEVNTEDLRVNTDDTQKGVLKLTLSIAYFLALVYFLFKLMA